LANRVIQFPVRNAFAAARAHDAEERDTEYRDSQKQAHRIVDQVDSEIARQAQRMATGRAARLEDARARGVITMQPATKTARLRKRVASLFKTTLFSAR
jgi:hypothetical protein